MSCSNTEWPVPLRGITETVITTQEPSGQWNAAALGIKMPLPATATTWGNTRTKRNFRREAHGYVQFTQDPVLFVNAALDIVVTDSPILQGIDAWAEVTATSRETGVTDGTQWEIWELSVTSHQITDQTVPQINRGFNAVIDASVAASRLSVAGYNTEELLDRIDYLESVVTKCGGPREQEAFAKIRSFCPPE